NRLLWMQDALGLDATDRVLQKTPFSFDVSVWEFFWPLMVGPRLVVAKPGGHQDPDYLAAEIARREVTTLHFVPSMLQVFLEARGLEGCAALRRVVCSGEALPAELARRYYELFAAPLINLYGPTEAAVDVSVWWCRRGDERATVPTGRAAANTEPPLVDRGARARQPRAPQRRPRRRASAGRGRRRVADRPRPGRPRLPRAPRADGGALRPRSVRERRAGAGRRPPPPDRRAS